jgi:NADH-quinone oxidoreductase subunit J
MTRTLIILAAVLWVAAGAAPAIAAETPCPPQVAAGVRAAMRGAMSPTAAITCRVDAAAHAAPGAVDDGHGHGEAAATGSDFEVGIALSDGRRATLQVSPQGDVRSTTFNHQDLSGSSGKGMALLFWIFALASVGGAVFVITRRNLIAAVMGMVGSFIGIAAIYMMLYAQFLAVVQMLVYAGAIMVLFVFVVMILNRPEDEPVAPTGRAGQALGGIAILYLVARLIMILMQVEPPNPEIAMAAPPPTAEGYDWGSVRAVGTDLFGPGLFPFEAISLLLLLAVVGAIAIARPLHAANGDERPEGGVA